MLRRMLLAVLSSLMVMALIVSPQAARETAAVGQTRAAAAPAPSPAPNRAAVATALRSSPVMFIENAGQFADGARFQVRGGQGTMWLANDAIWITVSEKPSEPAAQFGAPRLPADKIDHPEAPLNGVNLKLTFVNANPKPTLEPFNRLDTHVSYFIGNDPNKWRPDVPVWGGVRYKDIYPGIDLEMTSEQGGRMVQRMIARSGADLSAVQLHVDGADRLALEGDSLRLTTTVGEFALPLFQAVSAANRSPLPKLGEGPGVRADTVVAPFTSSDPPATASVHLADNSADLLYATFLGGTSTDVGYGIAVDGSGAAYVTGETDSAGFPTSAGAFDASFDGAYDAFVVKLNAGGSALAYATFLGGTSDEVGGDIAVDGSGAAYVTGGTGSADFPTTSGAFDTSYNGGGGPHFPVHDAFVVKLNAGGSALAYATFLGGTGSDWGYGIAVDGSGAAYVTGYTQSADFPTSAGAFDTSFNGNNDAFVVKLNAGGTALAYSTFLGGTGYDIGYGIAVDGSGAAYVTGETDSAGFPTSAGAFDTSYNDGWSDWYDAFVVKLNAGGSSLVYATFLGGTGYDYGYDIAVNGSGAAYVTGGTGSADFPTSAGAFDTSYNGGYRDAFVVKLAMGGPVPATLFIGVSPASLPADGVSTAATTLGNAPASHRVRFVSSRGSIDAILPSTCTTNSAGSCSTTIKSSTPGTAIVTVQDLTTGRSLAVSAQVTFTGGSGQPPARVGDIVITSVDGDCGRMECPKDGFFMLGLNGLSLPLLVTIDWKGNTPGSLEFAVSGGYSTTVPATGTSIRYGLDINAALAQGPNALHITARSGTRVSQSYDLDLTGYRLPQWIMDDVNALPIIGDQALVLEMAFPGQPLCKHEQGDAKKPCEDFDWGFLPGDLNQFQWQTNVKLTLPTRGGAFEFELSRERDQALTGRPPKAFLKLLGHNFDVQYGGKLSGVLGPNSPYVVVQELELSAGISTEFSKDMGVVEALNALPPFGPVASAALSAVPPVRDWLNDRARLYAKVTPELSGKFNLGFQPDLHVQNLQLGLDIPFEVGAKADLWVIEGNIYGGLGGKATFGYDANDIHIASLKAYGFGGYKFRLTWFSIEDRGEWKLAEYPNASGQAELVFTATGPEPQWQLVGHPFDKSYSLFAAQPNTLQSFAEPKAGLLGGALQATITSTLVSNVYTYTEPALAVDPVSGKALMLWVHDDVNKPVGGSQEISYTLWNGASWSTPSGVTNDVLMDAAPQVAWTTGGNAVAVWQRLTETLPITATWDVTTASKIEIATSTYSQTTGAWSPVSLLSTNSYVDMTPQVARNSSGQLLTVWRRNQAGLLGGDTTNPDLIMAAFNNGVWGAPMTAVNNIPGLVDLGAGYGAGAATIAYSRYLTATGQATSTLQLFTSAWNGTTWSAPTQRTDDSLSHRNPQVVYNAANQPLIVWLAGPELRLQNLATSTWISLTLPTEIGSVDEFRIVQDASGNIAAVFTAQATQRDMFVALYDQAKNTWGMPVQLTDDRASETYPTAGLDASGRLLMGYASTEITSITKTTTISGTGEVITYTIPTEGRTDLLTLSHLFARNLSLSNSAVLLSDDHPAPGGSVVVSATVSNAGDLAVSDVEVRFTDGNTFSTTKVIPGILAGGFTSTVTATYTVPTSGGASLLAVTIDPRNVIAEANEGDNTAIIAAFGPDLSVADAGLEYWGGSDVGLKAVISNIGTTSAPTATIVFYRDSITGTLAATDTVPALAAGQGISLTTPWNYGALVAGTYQLVAIVNRSDISETFTANNVYIFTLDVRPDLAVSPYYLWATVLPDRSLTLAAAVYNFGSIAAPASEVVFYQDVPLADTARIATLPLPVLSPGSSMMVTATTGTALAGDHTYYIAINPSRTVPETTYANNLASISGVPIADYTGSPITGHPPLPVDFMNSSTGSITGYLWSFGDGVTSTLVSPSHTYTAAGSYTVTLTVLGPGGSNAMTRTSYIQPYTFDDVPPTHPQWPYIEKVYKNGITTGTTTNPPLYSPDLFLSRAQIATFIDRALGWPAASPVQGLFVDMPLDFWGTPWAETFYQHGVTTGCTADPLAYCPSYLLTKAQIATMIVRANGWTVNAPTHIFSDIAGTPAAWAEGSIEAFYAHSPGTQCSTSPLMFCPTTFVSRAYMAELLVKGFGL